VECGFSSIRALRFHSSSTFPDIRFRLGWSRLTNGELLAAAEGKFDVFVTADRNLRYQQSLAGRKLAVVVLPTTNWPQLRVRAEVIAATLATLKPGEYRELVLV
jgi:hypothetical protein